jgi:hypothetical protein
MGHPVTRDSIARTARTVPFRLTVAFAFLVLHVLAFVWMGHRYGVPFNAAPGHPPAFVDPAVDLAPERWNRLVVSRWDSQHYIDLALRGHSQCPPGALPQDSNAFMNLLYRCQLNFWPGYPFLGWLGSFHYKIPIDYALLGISLICSFIFLFLWTSPVMVKSLGLGTTYASLVAFNAHTTAFALVTIQTEPFLLLCTLGCLISLVQGRTLLAAILAGGATGIRVSGVAVGLAAAAAIAVATILPNPARPSRWLKAFGLGLLSGWGILALLAYFWIRMKNPLAYFDAHAVSYGHHPSLMSLIDPETRWLMRSITDPFHPGIWVAAALIWFALGHREALRGFPTPVQVFCYLLFFGSMGVSVMGTIDIGLDGNSRYTLALLPLFFAIGALLVRRPAALVVWLALSLWFYRQVDLCHYVGGVGSEHMGKCNNS